MTYACACISLANYYALISANAFPFTCISILSAFNFNNVIFDSSAFASSSNFNLSNYAYASYYNFSAYYLLLASYDFDYISIDKFTDYAKYALVFGSVISIFLIST